MTFLQLAPGAALLRFALKPRILSAPGVELHGWIADVIYHHGNIQTIPTNRVCAVKQLETWGALASLCLGYPVAWSDLATRSGGHQDVNMEVPVVVVDREGVRAALPAKSRNHSRYDFAAFLYGRAGGQFAYDLIEQGGITPEGTAPQCLNDSHHLRDRSAAGQDQVLAVLIPRCAVNVGQFGNAAPSD
ncbi:MAG: hypothetical protein ACK4GK_06285 [Ferrovibrio sp.]